MSGVYIQGMKMPTSCHECRFLEGDTMDGLCHAAEKWMDDEDFWRWYSYPEGDIDDSKPSNCPLVPVPDHGRLIDADALTHLMGMDEHFTPLEAMYLMELIADAPTVIEVEGDT